MCSGFLRLRAPVAKPRHCAPNNTTTEKVASWLRRTILKKKAMDCLPVMPHFFGVLNKAPVIEGWLSRFGTQINLVPLRRSRPLVLFVSAAVTDKRSWMGRACKTIECHRLELHITPVACYLMIFPLPKTLRKHLKCVTCREKCYMYVIKGFLDALLCLGPRNCMAAALCKGTCGCQDCSRYRSKTLAITY